MLKKKRYKKSKEGPECRSLGHGTVLSRVIRVRLIEKVVSEQRLEIKE